MRPSLLLLAISGLVLVPACASPGRGRDAGRGSDAGTRDTGGSTTPDTGGSTTPDTGGSTTPDTGGSTTPDTGGSTTADAGHDGSTVVRPDAFVVDTGTPAPDTGCANDMACSDGIGCNGAERCVAGACVPPLAPLDCNDMLPCTTDTCSEPGMCNHASTCTGGAACTATGCASSCTETPCRLLSPQCGCAGGQACYPQGATRVCAAVGTGTSGTPCTNNSSCAAGYVCLNVSSGTTPVNVCTRMCSADADCGGGLCEYELDDGTGMAVPGFRLCSHPCNAATNAGCAAGSVCTIFQEPAGTAMRTYTDCYAPTTGLGEDVHCTSGTECSPDRYCLDTMDGLGTGANCHHWCNTANNAGCTGGRTCLGLTPAVVAGGITYGLCSY